MLLSLRAARAQGVILHRTSPVVHQKHHSSKNIKAQYPQTDLLEGCQGP